MVTQNKLIRILQFKAPKTYIYGEFSTLKLKDLHYFSICCIAHKFIHSPTLLPEAIAEAINDLFCQMTKYMTLTLHRKDLHLAKIKSKLYGEKMISSQGTPFWSKLPGHLKETTSASIFKVKLKKCILDSY